MNVDLDYVFLVYNIKTNNMKKATQNIFTLGITLLLLSSCGKKYSCPAGDPDIVGARYNDGTTSGAT